MSNSFVASLWVMSRDHPLHLNDEIRKRDPKFHGNLGINKAPSYYFAVTFAPADTTAHCNVLLRVEVIHCV